MGDVRREQTPPVPAIGRLDEIRRVLGSRRHAVLLDYDGTLTPIVDRPELALLSADMRESVRRLARRLPVAIVSGRSLADVRALVDLPELHYVGNHGFELAGPDGRVHERGDEFLPDLERCRERLAAGLIRWDRARVEDKRHSLSVHYRQVAPDQVAQIEPFVDAVLEAFPRLRKHHGKKVFEVRPRLDWDKGRAALWLLDELASPGELAAVYVGDDVTDEDAFRALEQAGRGFGIRVGSDDGATAARYRLPDPDAVRRLLDGLAAA